VVIFDLDVYSERRRAAIQVFLVQREARDRSNTSRDANEREDCVGSTPLVSRASEFESRDIDDPIPTSGKTTRFGCSHESA
jgi:hypothetical protein